MTQLLVTSSLFTNQLYREDVKYRGEEYGLRVEHIDDNNITIAIERPDGYVDWPLRYKIHDSNLERILYDEPFALPQKVKNRVHELYEIYSDRSIVLKVLKELDDKYVILTANGSPTTIGKTPYNLLKYGRMKGKPIHVKSTDEYSVDETGEKDIDDDGSIIITSPDGISVPLLLGKFELALDLLGGKPIGEIWKKNYDQIINSLSSEKEAK
ncbi:MAG: hypothetical protein JRN20_23045 [Nitrososphaerota archaeon]|nr:hypothetical protein [Nitrososphaerota archaeon]